MSTLKVTNLQHPRAASANVTLDASGNADFNGKNLAGVASVNGSQLGGSRNLIINGGFDVWQRNTSFTGSGYTSDRWIVSTTDTNTAITKTANRDKRNTLRLTFNSGVNANIDQRIEAFGNVGYNQQVTLSFWVRGSIATTGTDICRIRNHTTATTLESFTYDITTSWTKVTKTFSANNTWSKDDVARLYLFINGASSAWSSGDWVEFSDVQLEVGDTATDFEHESYGTTLQKCQRYYQKWEGSNTLGAGLWFSANQVLGDFRFIKTMRTSPTISVSSAGFCKGYLAAGSSNSNDSSTPFDTISINSARFNLNMVSTGTNGQGCMIQLNTSEYINVDAEL